MIKGKKMRSAIAAFLVLGIMSPALADEGALFDLLKKPAYEKSWIAVTKSEKGLPKWIRAMLAPDANYIANPARTVEIAGESYLANYAVMGHSTLDNFAAVLFNADGTRAWVEIVEQGKPNRYLGSPDPQQKAALDKILQDE